MFMVNHLVGFGGFAETGAAFPTLGSLQARYVSTLGITKDGSDLVATWADQSGNGRDLTQATGASKPLWVASQFNGQPILRFDGSDDYMQSTSFSATQPVHAFFVFKTTMTTGGRYMYSGSTVANHAVVTTGTATQVQLLATGVCLITPTSGAVGVLEAFWSGASSYTKYNAGSAVTGNAGTTGVSGGFLLGAAWDASSKYAMDIAELVICSAEITSTDYTALKAYFNATYGLTLP